MDKLKPYLTLLAVIFAHLLYGQQNKYEIGTPMDIPQNTGWNKVLCLKNGNTVLFHFEPQKNILVKVFDSLHKEVGSSADPYRYLDIGHAETTRFRGAVRNRWRGRAVYGPRAPRQASVSEDTV